MAEFKLKYIIDADGTKAKSELETVETKIARLGGASGLSATQLDALTVGAGAAAAALAAVAAAAVTGTIALFNLTRSTAEFGSEIFDASEKTGLHAETLSAMKFAADQSGASLEQVTGGLSKFAKQVGAAADGSEKAEKALLDLGITPKEALDDLDGALAKVFKRIQDAKPGIEQMTLAQKAFGKAGADLLPFIKSFDGDLAGLVKRAKELGVTIDDEAARAADEFGDTLDTLNAQLAGVGREIGQELMPAFMEMARGMSDFLKENKGSARDFVTVWLNVLRGVGVALDDFGRTTHDVTGNTANDWLQWSMAVVKYTQAPILVLDLLLRKFYEVGKAARDADPLRAQASGTINLGGGTDTDLTGTRAPRKNFIDPAKEAERRRREEEQAERARIQRLRTDLQAELAERAQMVETALARNEATRAEGEISERASFEASQKLERDFLDFKMAILERELDGVKGNAEEEKRVRQEIHLLNLKIEETEFRQKVQYDQKAEELFRKELEREKQLNKVQREQLAVEERRLDILRERQTLISAPGFDQNGEPNVQPGGAGYLEGSDSAIARLYSELEGNAGAIAALDALTTAFQTLGQAVGQAVQAWVLYGKAGASVRQVTAQILAAVAQQAAVKAIFELAEGFAALALSFFGVPGAAAAATQHFIAAAIYGSIAGVAALAGRAVAGNSFNRESSASGGGGSGGEAANNQNAPLVFTERFNGFQRQMSEMLDRTATVMGGMAEAVDGFTNKFSAVSPGHVVMAGAGDASREIREAFETELGTDLRAATNLFRQTGQYR